jgi:hypothetical protein
VVKSGPRKLPPAREKPRTGRELIAALRATGLVGMWREKEDIGDSAEFARGLRERAQRRKKG